MQGESNAPAPMTPNHALGLLAGGSGAELLNIESRGTGLVATLSLGGCAFRVQLDAVGLGVVE